MRVVRRLASVSVLAAGCKSPALTDTVNPGAGSIAWRVTEIRSPLGAGALAVDATHVYAYRSGLAMSAIRLADQRVAWTAGVDETLDNNFALRGLVRCADRVIYGSFLKVYAVAPGDGTRQWSWRPSQGGALGYGAPVCDGATVYLGTGQPMLIYALDAATGQEKWHVNLSQAGGGKGFVATPRIADGVVVGCTREFLSSVTGMIVGVDATTGLEKWRHVWVPLAPTKESSCAVSVALGSGIAVGAADDGRIFGLDLQTGALRWTAPPVTGFSSIRDERPVWIVDSTVIAGSGSGVVTGLNLANGEQRWRISGGVETTVLDPIAGDRGQFIAVSTSGATLAFEAATGRRAWTLAPGRGLNEGKFFAPGVLTSELFIAIATDGLYAVRR